MRTRSRRGLLLTSPLLAVFLGALLLAGPSPAVFHPAVFHPAGSASFGPRSASSTPNATQSFSAALGRLVELAAAGGGALLALVWVRVALSWFSNDVAKKVQAKDRARDALVGTLLFTAAVSGLVWALAQWVVSGS
ncbi:MAG: hypothetical protein ACREC5_02730 [Thermoplasmata archaeon]